MYWSVFLLSTRINPFGRANIMALAGKRGVDSSSALREGDQTRIDLTFGRQRAPSDRSAVPLPAVCDGGMQHLSPVVTSPTSPPCTSSTGKSQCVGLPRSGSCARAKVEVAKWGNTLKPESRWQDRRRAHGMALAASSHGFHTEQGSAKLQAEPTPVPFRDHEELCGANERLPTNPASLDLPISFLRT
jgi:hypothetical protein